MLAVADVDAFRFITLLFMLRARDLRLISVWHPSYLSLLLRARDSIWTSLVRDIHDGTVAPSLRLPEDVRAARVEGKDVLIYYGSPGAYLLAGLKLGSAGLVVSIVLYGSAVFAIPAIMAAAIGDYLGLSRAATAFATVTIFFAVGQTIGPAGAGLIARMHGSFTTAYLLASLLTALAAVFAAFLPHPVHAEAE